MSGDSVSQGRSATGSTAAGGYTVDSQGNVVGPATGGQTAQEAFGAEYGDVIGDTTAAGLLGQPETISQINRNVAEAAMQQQVQNELQSRSIVRGLLVNPVTKALAKRISPVPGIDPVSALDKAFAPATEAQLMDAAVEQFATQGGVVSNPEIGGSLQDRISGTGLPGDIATFGKGMIAGTTGNFGPNGEPESPMTTLIRNSIQGLNPGQQQVQAPAPAQSPQNYDPLWEALIPTLRLKGQTIADTILANSNFQGGGLYNGN